MQHYQRIRDLREDSDLTQEALCKKLYMHKTTYTNYEQGKHTVPLDFAVQLADFYQSGLHRRTHQHSCQPLYHFAPRRRRCRAPKIQRPHRTQQG